MIIAARGYSMKTITTLALADCTILDFAAFYIDSSDVQSPGKMALLIYVVFTLNDDHRQDFMSFMDTLAFLETPNLDHIREHAVISRALTARPTYHWWCRSLPGNL